MGPLVTGKKRKESNIFLQKWLQYQSVVVWGSQTFELAILACQNTVKTHHIDNNFKEFEDTRKGTWRGTFLFPFLFLFPCTGNISMEHGGEHFYSGEHLRKDTLAGFLFNPLPGFFLLSFTLQEGKTSTYAISFHLFLLNQR